MTNREPITNTIEVSNVHDHLVGIKVNGVRVMLKELHITLEEADTAHVTIKLDNAWPEMVEKLTNALSYNTGNVSALLRIGKDFSMKATVKLVLDI